MSKELAAKERKAQKQKSTAEQLLEGLTGADPNDKLRQNASQLMAMGADEKQRALAEKKQHLAGLQQALLDASEHLGVDPKQLVKKAKNGMTLAANGYSTPPGVDAATVQALAKKYGVDPGVIQKMIAQESRNNPEARSNRGALGVMQLMPATAKKYGLTPQDLTSKDPKTMKKVVEAGIKEYASLVKRNGGDSTLGLVAYNGGQGAVEFVKKQLGKQKISGEDWTAYMQKRHTQKPTDKVHAWQNETLDYVKNITAKQSDEDFETGARHFNQHYYSSPIPKPGPFQPTATPAQPFKLPEVPQAPTTQTGDTPDTTYHGNFNFQTFDRSHLPSNVAPLKMEQYLPEAVAVATNHPEAVWMQRYNPEYLQPYQVSMQDSVDENNAQFRGYERMLQDDPSALGYLASQRYAANTRVLGEQFRQNQAIEAGVVNQNVGIANDAQLKNLQLADTQYTRQEMAKSKTKALNQEALSSVSSKILQNDFENRRLAAYENLYDYRFQDLDGDGTPETLKYMGPDAVFNFDPNYQSGQDGYQTITKRKYGPYGQDAGYEVTNKELVPQGQSTTAKSPKKKANGGSLNSLYNQMVAKMR